MQFQTYQRRPFQVEAVQVTLENIEEIAEMVGVLKHKGDGTPYIEVEKDVKKAKFVPNIFNVHLGYWVTRMGNTTRCYSPKVFNSQYEIVVDV